MSRVVSVICLVLIVFILVTDIGLVVKYYQKPNAYALMSQVSSFHYIVLHKVGIQFAHAKVVVSLLLLVSWLWKFLYPSKMSLLKNMTVLYSLLWVLIGMLVLTGIVGVLQYSAGAPIELYNFSSLVKSTSFAQLFSIVLSAVILPMVLMFMPRIYNYTLRNA